MKNIISSTQPFLKSLALLSLFAAWPAAADISPSAANTNGPHYGLVSTGPHTRVWTNEAGRTVTEIGTGLNYWDGQQWSASDPTFQISPDGTAFIAEKVQHQIHLNANLNVRGAVTTATPDGTVLKSTPVAVTLYDAASGNTQIIGTIQDSTGVQVSSNQVVYSNAFKGICADLVYSLDHGSFRQDVIFTGKLDPADWNYPSNTTEIQVVTEFYNAPEHREVIRPVYVERDRAKRDSMVTPDVVDKMLNFGNLVFGPGRAFPSVQGTNAASTNKPSGSKGTIVAKDWISEDNRTFLQESIPYRWVWRHLQSLPPCNPESGSSADPHGRHGTKNTVRRAVASIPTPPLEGKQAHATKQIPDKKKLVKSTSPGFVVDYIVTLGDTPTQFASDTTYFVYADVYCSSDMEIEGGCVFKYPNGGMYSGDGSGSGAPAIIDLGNPVVFETTMYRPCIFTASDDDSVGATMNGIDPNYTGSTAGNTYAAPAIQVETYTSLNASNLRFCFAAQGILIYVDDFGGTSSFSQYLADSQFINCIQAILVTGDPASSDEYPYEWNTLTLQNCLMANVSDAFTVYGCSVSNTLYNCTFGSVSLFMYDTSDGVSETTTTIWNVTNCVFSSVSDYGWGANSWDNPNAITMHGAYNGFYIATNFGTSCITNTSTPYQTAGAGNYYLPQESPWLAVGTTNIGGVALADIESRTTYAPLVMTNTNTVNCTLFPVVSLDNSGTGLTLGYHYPPVDFLVACAVSNCAMSLTNGVVVAYYGNPGIRLFDGGSLYSQGTPNAHDVLAHYTLVQEEPAILVGAPYDSECEPIGPNPVGTSADPFISLRLTSIYGAPGANYVLRTADTNQIISGLTLRDCEVYGAGAFVSMNEADNTPSVSLQNNLFYRTPFLIDSSGTISNLDNLFWSTTNVVLTNTTISIRYRSGTSPNSARDNAFDGCFAVLDGSISNNAYLNGGTNTTLQPSDIVTNLTWINGPLGSYYQPTNSPLLHAGDVTADKLGLYHYSVLTNMVSGVEIPETNSTVSIGYHYVAVGTNGLPLDTNGDGIPDYLEDANGNGLVDSGEIDWLVSGDLGLTVIITQPANNTSIP